MDSPFFKKSENFHDPGPEHKAEHQSHFDADFHGVGGPLDTTYSVTYAASHRYWDQTMHQLGIDTNRSHFSGSNVGCWTSLTGVNPERRERCYSATSYYKPNAERENLILLTEATVRKVILEHVNGRWEAKGVAFAHEGADHAVKTRGEVILCAGSVQSPQLLELSGIGDPEVLKAAGIPVKVTNAYVGENLQEHMSKHSDHYTMTKLSGGNASHSDRHGIRDRSINHHTRRPSH